MKKKPEEQPIAEQQVVEEQPVVDPKITELETLVNERTNDLQRTRADFENYRKQVEAQKAGAVTIARNDTVEKFLPLIDDMYRAIATYPEQLAPLLKSFETTLQNLGLAIIPAEPGTEFNPDFHEAVMFEEGEGDVQRIIEVLRPGYLYNGLVLRPTMVKVG